MLSVVKNFSIRGSCFPSSELRVLDDRGPVRGKSTPLALSCAGSSVYEPWSFFGRNAKASFPYVLRNRDELWKTLMSNQPDRDDNRRERLDEIIGEFLVAVDSGQNPNPAEWLARHPDFCPELAEFFADRARLDDLVEPFLANAATTVRQTRPHRWPRSVAARQVHRLRLRQAPRKRV